MSRYKPYPQYKDSGVEWLGKVPAHWEVKRLKYNLILQTNKVTIDEHEVIALENIESKTGKYISTESSYQGEDVAFKNGDILFGKLRPYLSKVYKCNSNGIAFGDLLTFRPNEYFDSNFAFYSLLSEEFIKIVDSSTYGAKMPRASSEFINEMFLATPSLDEQIDIASHLTRTTYKIDTLIQKQENLIELLKEKRQALISHAVTKGLNRHVKMKDSGIEWLGEVPEHWEVKPLKYIKAQSKNSFVDGPFGSNLKSEHFIDDGEVYVIESGFITTGKFIFKDFKTISYQHFETIKRSSCTVGDIIIAKIGANFGMAAELPKLNKESVVSGNSLKITLDNNKLLNQLLIHYLGLAKKIGGFDDIVNTSAQPALSLGGLNNMRLPIPAMQEQQQIINYLDQKTSKIDKLIKNTNKAIELLKERRTALISATVTGKIDVRNVHE